MVLEKGCPLAKEDLYLRDDAEKEDPASAYNLLINSA